MYSQLETIVISYVNSLNKLVKSGDETDQSYAIKQIIIESIDELERLGCKIRLIENIFSVVEINQTTSPLSRL
jgi:hypothetical protein